MSTLTVNVSDIPMGDTMTAETPAEKLRHTAAAVRVQFTAWGISRALSASQKANAAEANDADPRLTSAGKKIIDPKHPAYRALGALRSQIRDYWSSMTLPYVEDGVRLIRQSELGAFIEKMQDFKAQFERAERDLDAEYDSIRADASHRLGRLYNPADYPPMIKGMFTVSWDFPSVEPPSYLMQLAPEVYAKQQALVAARFAQAVELAEQAFATEFSDLLEHLTERLSPDETGKKKVFRDSAVENLTGFFERFKALNLGSNASLDAMVKQAQDLVSGVTPDRLRNSASLRGRIAEQLAQVKASLDPLIIDAPRRSIIRPTTPPPAADPVS